MEDGEYHRQMAAPRGRSSTRCGKYQKYDCQSDCQEKIQVQCSPFITHLVITQIWMQHGHGVAPQFICHVILQRNYLRNELDFWKVHGIMTTLGLLQRASR